MDKTGMIICICSWLGALAILLLHLYVKNNNPKGILLILIAMFVISIQDAIMKYIYSNVSLYEVYFIRTLVGFLIIVLFMKITSKPIIFTTHYPFLTSCRVILFFFGFSSFSSSVLSDSLHTYHITIFSVTDWYCWWGPVCAIPPSGWTPCREGRL